MTARLYLVRHGEASAGWAEARDPGLSPLGRAQAASAARDLAERVGQAAPLEVYVSPLARCRETARPFERHLGTKGVVTPTVAELPTPPGMGYETRAVWLRKALGGAWSDLLASLDDAARARMDAWRANLLAFALARQSDCLVVSHFIAINVLVAQARGDTKVAGFRPGNGSITELLLEEGVLRIARLGSEGATRVALGGS